MRHLIDIESLADDDLHLLLDRAGRWADEPPAGDRLSGAVILNLFLEDSTRTRISFDMAACRLGAKVITFTAGGSSIAKGETLHDTLETLARYRPDAVVMRSGEYAAPRYAKTVFSCPVINAGDSWRAHPTQALLDAVTMQQARGGLDGLTVAICGDIAHSRVARSNYVLLTRMGVHVRLVAPAALMPKPGEMPLASRHTSMEDGLPGADIVMMLRIQKERIAQGLGDLSEVDFFASYGLTPERLALAGPDAFVMHPGPMNRNVEIADAVADDPFQSLILRQVENGIPTRMAVLDWAVNGS